jgi:hypothetical protein
VLNRLALKGLCDRSHSLLPVKFVPVKFAAFG